MIKNIIWDLWTVCGTLKGGAKMIIYLYNNESPKNKISKSITLLKTITGVLRGETNIVSPVIRIEQTTFPLFNYAYIPDFSRYYYLRDVREIRANMWDISLISDPLMSFNINSVSGVVVEAQNGGSDYLEHRHFIRNVKSKTNILTFSNGLLDTGEYILITAGG